MGSIITHLRVEDGHRSSYLWIVMFCFFFSLWSALAYLRSKASFWTALTSTLDSTRQMLHSGGTSTTSAYSPFLALRWGGEGFQWLYAVTQSRRPSCPGFSNPCLCGWQCRSVLDGLLCGFITSVWAEIANCLMALRGLSRLTLVISWALLQRQMTVIFMCFSDLSRQLLDGLHLVETSKSKFDFMQHILHMCAKLKLTALVVVCLYC